MNQNTNCSSASQSQKILDHMNQGNRITALEALNTFGCFRLAARINDLKNEGVPVRKEMVDRNGKKIAQYYVDDKRQTLRTV